MGKKKTFFRYNPSPWLIVHTVPSHCTKCTVRISPGRGQSSPISIEWNALKIEPFLQVCVKLSPFALITHTKVGEYRVEASGSRPAWIAKHT